MLRRALSSVRLQRRPVDEIIVVNDGTMEVEVPGAVMVRTGPYAGPGAARNAGARAAVCDFLAFLDDDDEWAPDHLEAIDSLLHESDVAATAFHRQTRVGGVELRRPPPFLRAADWFVRNQGIQGSNLAVRRRTFLQLLGFDELLWCGQDMEFAIRCADGGVRYAMSELPTVICHAHPQPRITSPGPRHRHAHRTFLAAHGSRMLPEQVAAFCERVGRLFGVDPGPLPRLIWVLGPPGGGKSTWAHRHARGDDRVLDLVAAMPWLDGADVGVRTAKRHVAAAIRATESQRAPGDRRLFVSAADFAPQDLGPPQEFEHVVVVVPEPQRWLEQIGRRMGPPDDRCIREYDQWASRFGTAARAANAGDRA